MIRREIVTVLLDVIRSLVQRRGTLPRMFDSNGVDIILRVLDRILQRLNTLGDRREQMLPSTSNKTGSSFRSGHSSMFLKPLLEFGSSIPGRHVVLEFNGLSGLLYIVDGCFA